MVAGEGVLGFGWLLGGSDEANQTTLRVRFAKTFQII